ncbi:hypothetical protein DIE02_27745 [Burkholderia sp. Bp8991]|nr:hypothetical protein DIE02_27745 [Burkholderia sp. Bp8991]
MLAELASAADDRLADLAALGTSIARLAKDNDPTVSRLGSLVEYLASDSASDISYRLTEILECIDAEIEQAGEHRG